VLVVFPPDRFDLNVAAALGKKDWDSILGRERNMAGSLKDQIYEHGADFIAGVEFLSEVFVDGKPLSKPQFEQDSVVDADGTRSMEVHFPRFGPVLLLSRPDGARFVTSRLSGAGSVVDSL
jgi:hypothetical protein